MSDIELAKKILNDNELSLVVVKDGKAVFESADRGIRPLYLALVNQPDDLCGASAADRVVGKGAAVLFCMGRVGEIHSKVVSEPALTYFEANGVKTGCDKLVERILNRKGDGGCPVEALAMKAKTPEELLGLVKQFLDDLGLLP